MNSCIPITVMLSTDHYLSIVLLLPTSMEFPFIVLNALLEGAREKSNVKNIDGRIWNLPIWIGSGQNIFAGVFCRN